MSHGRHAIGRHAHGRHAHGRHAIGRHATGRRARRTSLTVLAGTLAGTLLLAVADGAVPAPIGTSLQPARAVRLLVAAPPPPLPPSVPTPPPAPAVDTTRVLADVAAAGSAARGTIAVSVLAPSGAPLLTGPDAGHPGWTASLVKLLVIAEVLARHEATEPPGEPDDTDLLRRAASASDDAAMNRLWVRYAGPDLVTAAAARVGLAGTAAPSRRDQWGEATTTAGDITTFLARLGQAYGPEVRATLLDWLRGATPVAADGFDQRFGLLSPGLGAGPVAAKQGWMCCIDGRRQLHSVGVLPDGRVVALLGDFPTRTSWSRAAAALDAAAVTAVAGTRLM